MPAPSRGRWQRQAPRELRCSTTSLGGRRRENLGDRNHAGARWPAVKALENLVHVLPGFDQCGCQRRFEAQIAGDAPLALEAPVDRRSLVAFKRYHTPTLFRRENFFGLAPWQVDKRSRTHCESIAFVDRDPEWFIATAITPVEDRAQLRNRHVEHADCRARAANHPAAAANHAILENRDEVVQRSGGSRGAREMRQHRDT